MKNVEHKEFRSRGSGLQASPDVDDRFTCPRGLIHSVQGGLFRSSPRNTNLETNRRTAEFGDSFFHEGPQTNPSPARSSPKAFIQGYLGPRDGPNRTRTGEFNLLKFIQNKHQNKPKSCHVDTPPGASTGFSVVTTGARIHNCTVQEVQAQVDPGSSPCPNEVHQGHAQVRYDIGAEAQVPSQVLGHIARRSDGPGRVPGTQPSVVCEGGPVPDVFMEDCAERDDSGASYSPSLLDSSSKSRDILRSSTFQCYQNGSRQSQSYGGEQCPDPEGFQQEIESVPQFLLSSHAAMCPPVIQQRRQPRNIGGSRDSSQVILGHRVQEEMDIPDEEGSGLYPGSPSRPDDGLGRRRHAPARRMSRSLSSSVVTDGDLRDGERHLTDSHSPFSVPTPIQYNIDLLQQVFSNPAVSVIKSIPRNARVQVAVCVASLLRDIVSRPDDVATYVRFFLFPRAVLRRVEWATLQRRRRKDRPKIQLVQTITRLNSWIKGGVDRDALVTELISTPSAPVHHRSHSSQQNIRRCIKIATQDGRYGKAVSALSSNGIAPPDASTLLELQRLHPQSDLPVHVQPPGVSLEVSDQTVLLMLKSFPKGTATSRSGWSPQHLLECALPQTNVSVFSEHLTAVVNLFLSGRASAEIAPFVASANLVPLLKKDSSIRPIAVGETLRRLISKCCTESVTRKVADMLSPLQVGVGVSKGAEAVIHAFNDLARDSLNADNIMALVDFKNAFNTVSRSEMFEEVLSRIPEIFAWVQYSYGNAAKLFSYDSVLEATTGVQQGDPLGPLLFALALHPVLTRLKELFPGLYICSYLDDLTLFGERSVLERALPFVEDEGAQRGLTMSLQKTVLWCPRNFSSHCDGSLSRYTWSWEPGVKLLGGVVSESAEFSQKVAQERIQKCEQTLSLLLTIEDPQVILLLMRACEGMPKLVYTWRTIPPEYLGELALRFSLVLQESLRKLILANGPGFSDFHLQLSSLPVSLGGLGISLPTDLIHFAYSSAKIESYVLQQRIRVISSPPTAPCLLNDPCFQPAIEQLNSLITLFHALSDDRILALRNTVHSPPPHTQHIMARAYFESKRSQLLESDFIRSKPVNLQRQFNAVLSSSLHPLASAWLFALPNEGLNQHMSAPEFQAALCFRLLLPQYPSSEEIQCRNCAAVMDPYGFHSILCKEKAHFLTRHNSVRNALFDLLYLARFNPKKDAPVTCLRIDPDTQSSTGLRPADLLIDGDDFSKECVDVCVVAPFLSASLPNTFHVGRRAEVAQKGKYDKHLHACHASGLGFRAFALDAFGVPASDAASLLDRIRDRLVRECDYGVEMATGIVYRKISISVQRAVAQQALNCRVHDC